MGAAEITKFVTGTIDVNAVADSNVAEESAPVEPAVMMTIVQEIITSATTRLLFVAVKTAGEPAALRKGVAAIVVTVPPVSLLAVALEAILAVLQKTAIVVNAKATDVLLRDAISPQPREDRSSPAFFRRRPR